MSQKQLQGSRSRWRLAASLLVAALAISIVVGKYLWRVGDERMESQLSDRCREQLLRQQELASIALHAMAAFGRIDPGLYSTKEGGGLVLNPGMRPLVKGDSANPQLAFDKLTATLAHMKGDTRGEFARAHERALERCASGACSPTAYPIDIVELDGRESRQSYAFNVQGDPPTPEQWQTFLIQYDNESGGDCPFVAPITLSRGRVSSRSPSALDPPVAFASSDEATPAAMSGGEHDTRSISGGTVELERRCTRDPPEAMCPNCKTVEEDNGQYFKSGPTWCCNKDCQP